MNKTCSYCASLRHQKPKETKHYLSIYVGHLPSEHDPPELTFDLATCKGSPFTLGEAHGFWNGPHVIHIHLNVRITLFWKTEDRPWIGVQSGNQVLSTWTKLHICQFITFSFYKGPPFSLLATKGRTKKRGELMEHNIHFLFTSAWRQLLWPEVLNANIANICKNFKWNKFCAANIGER